MQAVQAGMNQTLPKKKILAEKQKERRHPRRRSFVGQIARVWLLGFRLRPELLDLLALILDFLLLRLDLSLGLRVGVLRILQRIADYVAGTTAQSTADQRARERMAYGGTDNRTASSTYRRTAESAFFTSRERLPRASRKNESPRQRQTH
jgi:hypothetical protein